MTRATERIAHLLELTERLGALIARENELLANKRVSEMGDLHSEKHNLSQAYQQELEVVRHSAESFRDDASPEKERLKEATRRLHELLDENRQAIAAAKSVTERILKAIADEIERRRRPVQGYGNRAAKRAARSAHAGPTFALALDRTV